jgi:hypothetical protein
MDKTYVSRQCSQCKGAGLKKKTFVCLSCNGKACAQCEYIKSKGNYAECDICYGCGEIYTDKKSQKRTFKPLYCSEK